MTDSRAPSDLASLRPFDYEPRTRLVFGVNSAEQVGRLARDLGARKVLLVTDPGIVAAGHADRIRAHLEQAGLKVTVFDRARENPPRNASRIAGPWPRPRGSTPSSASAAAAPWTPPKAAISS